MYKERFTYEQVAKDSIRVFDNGKKMHPIGGVVQTLNDLNEKNKQMISYIKYTCENDCLHCCLNEHSCDKFKRTW